MLMFAVIAPCLPADELSQLQEAWVDKIIAPRHGEMQKMHEEISLYNLINGLHLTKQQIVAIVTLAQQAKEMRERYLGKGNDANAAALQQELNEMERLKQFAEQGKNVPASTPKGKRHHLRPNKSPKRAAVAAPPNMQHYQQELKRLESELDYVLIPAQKQVIEDFKPCLIPPKNLKNPVRIGQAKSNSHLSQWLTRIRNSKHEGYSLRLALQHLLKQAEKHQGSYKADERETILDKWEKGVAQARAMSDAEFEISKEELAQNLEPPDKKEKLQKIISNEIKTHNLPGKTAQFLLNPQIIPLLRDRLYLMLQNPNCNTQSERWQAESHCEDGSCTEER
jgi:hypothetical protein